MCNILEVQEGIRLLRNLFMDERSWTKDGAYGLLFGLIAGCIQADYGVLLTCDGGISFIELIKWAYRHQLYQQVLTLIESNAPTNLVNSGIFFYCDDEARKDEVTNLFALQRLEMKPYDIIRWMISNIILSRTMIGQASDSTDPEERTGRLLTPSCGRSPLKTGTLPKSAAIPRAAA